MSSPGAASRAAAPVSSARAEASRRNGAKSRGPKTEGGKARSAQNALKHGMRAQKYVVLPQEDAAEFARLEATLIAQLAPAGGALQTVLAQRVAVAAWRVARADRLEVELFKERHLPGHGLGLALIRDGNCTRSFETLVRYRGAAMAEFWRALRTLEAFQPEHTARPVGATASARARKGRSASRSQIDHRFEPNEPSVDALLRLGDLLGLGDRFAERPMSGRDLHEAPAPWTPNEPGRQLTGRAHAGQDAPPPDDARPLTQPPSPETLSRHASPLPVAAASGSLRAHLRASAAGAALRSAPPER
jgi:hypothetical protein